MSNYISTVCILYKTVATNMVTYLSAVQSYFQDSNFTVTLYLKGWDSSHQTKKPGTMLMLIWIHDMKGIFLPKSTLNADSCKFLQSLCAIACITISVYFKNPKHWQPYQWSCQNTAHTVTGRNGQCCSSSNCSHINIRRPKFPTWH